jgi:hypothetical protein
VNGAVLKLEAVDEPASETRQTTTEVVEIASIKRPEDLQVRQKGTDKSTVADYARAMAAIRDSKDEDSPKPRPFPPVICYRTKKGGPLLLADGAHRLEARELIGETTIEAEIRIGSKRDALEAALESAKQFGLRFSNADKRRAVILLLKDPKFGNADNFSDHDLAAKVGVSQPFVSKVRKEQSAPKPITVISEDTAPASSEPITVISDPPIERFRKLLAEVPAADLAAFQDQVLEALTAAASNQGEA